MNDTKRPGAPSAEDAKQAKLRHEGSEDTPVQLVDDEPAPNAETAANMPVGTSSEASLPRASVRVISE
eukprot:5371799-Prymnesium_polylepis.2